MLLYDKIFQKAQVKRTADPSVLRAGQVKNHKTATISTSQNPPITTISLPRKDLLSGATLTRRLI